MSSIHGGLTESPLGKKLAAEDTIRTNPRPIDGGVELFLTASPGAKSADAHFSGLEVVAFDGGTLITFTAQGTRMALLLTPDATKSLASSLDEMPASIKMLKSGPLSPGSFVSVSGKVAPQNNRGSFLRTDPDRYA